MAKPPPPGLCVHCVTHHEVLTWDHVFPKAWYPKTTPPNLEKWQVPACRKCNHEYGVLEEDLLIALAACLDPDHPDTADIVAKGMRAINPDCGKGGKDKKNRAKRRQRMLSQMMDPGAVPETAILPNFGQIYDQPTGGIRINGKYLKRLCEKIVRGISYLEGSGFIQPPHHIHFYLMHDADAQEYVALIASNGKTLARGPGIEVMRAVDPDDNMSSVYAITIWKRLKMYAVVDLDPVDSLTAGRENITA